MDAEVIRAIEAALRKPHLLGGFLARPSDWVADDPAALVKPGPTAKALVVSTLGAVWNYLASNKDDLELTRLVVHIASPAVVCVLGPLEPRARVREMYVQAAVVDALEGFLGKFWPLEDFLIGLQVRFADADERGRVLGLLSNVKHESVKTALDDGLTQVVQARAGIALVSEVAVPNPVLLAGFRTFRDIVQPSTLYVLRVQQGKTGGLPEAALFEADGGAWKLAATARIRDWLSDVLPAGVGLLA